jgi:hypothetical protein
MKTFYGEEIDTTNFSGLNRMEIRNAILELFEEEKLVCGKPIEFVHGDSVPNDNGGTSCGSIVHLQKWRLMMNYLEFTEQQSSTAGWKTYEIGGLTSPTRSEASLGKATFIEDSCWPKKTVGHSLVIHYRKREGGFFVYSGNVEDFFAQVSLSLRSIFISKTAERYHV